MEDEFFFSFFRLILHVAVILCASETLPSREPILYVKNCTGLVRVSVLYVRRSTVYLHGLSCHPPGTEGAHTSSYSSYVPNPPNGCQSLGTRTFPILTSSEAEGADRFGMPSSRLQRRRDFRTCSGDMSRSRSADLRADGTSRWCCARQLRLTRTFSRLSS